MTLAGPWTGLCLPVVALISLCAHAAPSGAPVPVVLELFTSEGCSSCPPADDLVLALERMQPIPGVELVPLALPVDYWNNLGWVDARSSPEFTERQERYAAHAGTRTIYTPQVVVDGREGFVPSEENIRREALAAAARHAGRLVLQAHRLADERIEGTVSVSGLPAGDFQIWVAVVESGLSSHVGGGENRGRLLNHPPVVRVLQRVPQRQGPGALHIPLQAGWNPARLKVVAFAQEMDQRGIVAVAVAVAVAPLR